MGGTGLLIVGTLSATRPAPRPVPRTFIDRLLGRTRTTGPRVRRTVQSELISLDASELAPLLARYRD
jgi:hypothetical protein